MSAFGCEDQDPASQAVSQAKYARSILAEEIKFRRDRRQQIFSWASSLLVAIIGGVTALAFTGNSVKLPQTQKCGLYAAILIVCGFRCMGQSSLSQREEIRTRL